MSNDLNHYINLETGEVCFRGVAPSDAISVSRGRLVCRNFKPRLDRYGRDTDYIFHLRDGSKARPEEAYEFALEYGKLLQIQEYGYFMDTKKRFLNEDIAHELQKKAEMRIDRKSGEIRYFLPKSLFLADREGQADAEDAANACRDAATLQAQAAGQMAEDMKATRTAAEMARAAIEAQRPMVDQTAEGVKFLVKDRKKRISKNRKTGAKNRKSGLDWTGELEDANKQADAKTAAYGRIKAAGNGYGDKKQAIAREAKKLGMKESTLRRAFYRWIAKTAREGESKLT